MQWASRTSIIFVFLLACSVYGKLFQGQEIKEALLPSYDYVIVGCGISGLVVANRLSEDNGMILAFLPSGVD